MLYKKDGNIDYTVNFRTELLGIILILSDKYKNLVGNKMIPLNNKYIYDHINLKFIEQLNYLIKLLIDINILIMMFLLRCF